MGAMVEVSINKQFDVNADIDTVFALLSNVPESASHFPKVAQLVDEGDNTYRWEMEEMAAAGFSHQVIYAAKYHSDKDSGSITWTAVPGVGNSLINGSWALSSNGSGTSLTFTTTGELNVPVPRLMAKMAKPVVTQQFSQEVDTYISNLKNALG